MTVFMSVTTDMAHGREDEAHWTTFIQSGAVDALMTIITDNYFCGFTKEELSIWPPPDVDLYLNGTVVSRQGDTKRG